MNEQLLSIGKTAKLLGVSIDTIRRWDRDGVLESFRPSIKSKRYFRKTDIEKFLSRNNILAEPEIINVAKQWVTADTPAQLPASWHCRTSDVFNGRLDTFARELNAAPDLKEIFPLIAAIAGEIGNNSFNHNLGHWRDTPGAFFGYDIGRGVTVLADRGQGIRETLKRVLPRLKDDLEALRAAFTDYVSGRAPENRGNGLKFVKDVVIAHPSLRLQFQSGIAVLNLDRENPSVEVRQSELLVNGCLAVLFFRRSRS